MQNPLSLFSVAQCSAHRALWSVTYHDSWVKAQTPECNDPSAVDLEFQCQLYEWSFQASSSLVPHFYKLNQKFDHNIRFQLCSLLHLTLSLSLFLWLVKGILVWTGPNVGQAACRPTGEHGMLKSCGELKCTEKHVHVKHRCSAQNYHSVTGARGWNIHIKMLMREVFTVSRWQMWW